MIHGRIDFGERMNARYVAVAPPRRPSLACPEKNESDASVSLIDGDCPLAPAVLRIELGLFEICARGRGLRTATFAMSVRARRERQGLGVENEVDEGCLLAVAKAGHDGSMTA